MTVYFVTTNTAKFSSFAAKFSQVDINLQQHSVELNELQEVNKEKIIAHKLQQAKLTLPNKNVLVDDRGFYIDALNGFPGPLVKPVLQTIGISGLLKLLAGEKNRTARFISAIGYFDGKKDHYFFDEEIGHITAQPRGNNTRGWTELLYIFISNHTPNKTLGELTDAEWKSHVTAGIKNDCRLQILSFIKQQNTNAS